MATPVGCLTVIVSRIVGHPQMRRRETVEQDWYLHPTKGWRRGSKRKQSVAAHRPLLRPFFTFKRIWKDYRR